MRKIFLIISLVSLFIAKIEAQQDPHYTQYMYNMNIMNPAYAGSKENLSVGLLYRMQWIDIEDAPKTGTLSIHSPVGKNVGLGLSAIMDKIGPVEENNVYADFSYTLNLGGEHRLAFGVKAGATFHKVGLFSDISAPGFVHDTGDPFLSSDVDNTYVNVGAGFFYYTNKYYLAVSVPNFLKTTHLDVTQSGQQYKFGSETQHYFVTGGYVFELNNDIKLKPSFMVKSAFDAPTSVDGSLNCLFKERFEIGATYRLDDSFGGMATFAVNPNIKIGYAYDHVTSDLKFTTPSSHEILLLFNLNFPKKVSVSPRYF